MTTTQAMTSGTAEAHRQALILKHRCPHCAETADNSVLLRGAPCPSCGEKAQWSKTPDAEAIIATIEGKWTRMRLVVYGVLALVAFLGSVLPIAGSIALLITQVIVYYAIVKGATRWFSPGRRMTTKFALKMWMVLIGLFGIAALETLTLAAGLNLILKPVLSVLALLVFVETSLWFLRSRLRKEATGAKLQWWEWGLPAAMFAAVACAGMVAALALFSLIAVAQEAFSWLGSII